MPHLAPSILLVLLALTLVTPAAWGFAIVGYLPEWRYEGANFALLASQLTHLVLFSLEPDSHGGLAGLDRFPRSELLAEAREETRQAGTKLLVCFGGNGRSAGFSRVVRSPNLRSKFVKAVAEFVATHALDGVDYNWEYPGYVMGRGYSADGEVQLDYAGLALLVAETRAALGAGAAITLAYYPDMRQEALLAQHRLDEHADLLHAMAYDAVAGGGGPPGAAAPTNEAGHSPMSLARRSISQWATAGLPLAKLTVGLPFYGRHSTTGDWTTYEDLVQAHDPLPPEIDAVPASGGGGAWVHFNGVDTIRRKTALAVAEGAGGVMIWESGQDCRLASVTHGAVTHGRTCPGTGDERSLHAAVLSVVSPRGAAAALAGIGSAGGEL